MEYIRVQTGEMFTDTIFALRSKVRAVPNRVLESDIEFTTVVTSARFVCLCFGGQSAVPCGSLLDHANDSGVVARQVVGGGGGSTVIDGVEVGGDLAGVGVGESASVGSDAPCGRFELLERAA